MVNVGYEIYVRNLVGFGTLPKKTTQALTNLIMLALGNTRITLVPNVILQR
jgi:hypothetical protein